MDCQTIREQCATGDGNAGPVLEHLAGCAECRAAVEAQREARAALDAWPRSESPVDVDAVLAAAEFGERSEIAQFASERSRRASRRATWIGLAAGIVAFVALSLVGTRVESTSGSLRITFGTAPVAGADASIEALVEQEVIARLAPVVRTFVAATERSAAAQRQMLAELASAVDLENRQDRALDEAREQRIVDGVLTAIAFRGPPHQP